MFCFIYICPKLPKIYIKLHTHTLYQLTWQHWTILLFFFRLSSVFSVTHFFPHSFSFSAKLNNNIFALFFLDSSHTYINVGERIQYFFFSLFTSFSPPNSLTTFLSSYDSCMKSGKIKESKRSELTAEKNMCMLCWYHITILLISQQNLAAL